MPDAIRRAYSGYLANSASMPAGKLSGAVSSACFGLIDRSTLEIWSRLDAILYACVRFVASSRPV